MQEIKNRKGLALGVVATLVSSLFGAVPAAYSSETAVVITATGDGAQTKNSMLHTEVFETFLRFGTGVATRTENFGISYVIDSASAAVIISRDADGEYASGAADVTAQSVSGVANDGYATFTSLSPYVRFSVPGLTSVSPAVAITVTPYMELDSAAGLTAGDAAGTPYTINFVPWSALGAAVTLTTPVADGRGITASVTLTEGTIRWSQLDGSITTQFSLTNAGAVTNSASVSGVAGSDSTVRSRTGANLAEFGYSFSAAVRTDAFTTSDSVSAQVWYTTATSSVAANAAIGSGRALTALTATTKVAVGARTINGASISAVTGANVRNTGDGTADARINSAFTMTAFGYSASATTSIAAAKSVTVSAVGSNMEFDADSGVILNGVTYTSSSDLRKASFDLAASTHTFTMSTFGQDANTSNDTVTLRVSSQLRTHDVVVTFKTPTLTPSYTPTAVAGLAGQSKSFTLTVADQWNQTPVRTDLRIKAVMVLPTSGGSESEAVSANVAGGTATVTLAPLPATRTGSGTVTFTLQTFNQDTQKWDDGGTDSATWNVYSYAAGTDAFVSRTATASMSVSYGVRGFSWSGVVAVEVANSFSDVVVSAPGLVIENNDQTSITGSGTLTVAANGKTANLRFAGTKPGTYTVTYTQGTASTTSIITISAAGSDRGDRFTFDTTAIDSGKTRQIVGTLLDANGNPVDTTLPGTGAGDSGTASILITVAGTAGIVASTLPTETDANGQFRLSVLTAAADSGALVITATYYRGSTAVATFTTTQTVTVAPAAAPEVNAVIGSFNGRWAVRVENARGSVVSVKAGNRWVKFSALNNNYLFSRKSVVGRTIAVSVWVDGELQNSQTITIK